MVFSVVPSSAAIRLLGFPSATSEKTSRSRGVSVARRLVASLAFGPRLPPRPAAGDRANHRVEDRPVVHGLLQEVDGPVLHRPDRAAHVPVRAEEHHRHLTRVEVEPGQQIEPRGVLEPQVEEHTVRNRVGEGFQELTRRAHHDHVQRRGPEQPGQGRAHRPVVVHDPDHHRSRHRAVNREIHGRVIVLTELRLGFRST